MVVGGLVRCRKGPGAPCCGRGARVPGARAAPVVWGTVAWCSGADGRSPRWANLAVARAGQLPASGASVRGSAGVPGPGSVRGPASVQSALPAPTSSAVSASASDPTRATATAVWGDRPCAAGVADVATAIARRARSTPSVAAIRCRVAGTARSAGCMHRPLSGCPGAGEGGSGVRAGRRGTDGQRPERRGGAEAAAGVRGCPTLIRRTPPTARRARRGWRTGSAPAGRADRACAAGWPGDGARS